MSPNEWIPYEAPFAMAAARFGWVREIVQRNHERDDRISNVAIWTLNGKWLFDEDDMGENMVRELIRIGGF